MPSSSSINIINKQPLSSCLILSINDRIREWEIKAHDKDADKQELRFMYDRLKYHNGYFVDFLVGFYGLEGKTVLDYGCGAGFFANMFAERKCRSYGCDISNSLISFAKTQGSATFFIDDFFNSKLRANNYDFIFCRDLGPLQKIDYTQENSKLVKVLIDALNPSGIAYFILMGNLSGTSDDDRFTGFRNPTIETIRQFFGYAGHIAFVNVFKYQAVVVAKSKEVAESYHAKMYASVKYMMDHLNEWDSISKLKCDKWLEINGHSQRQAEPHSQSFLYFLSGDQERYFEQYYLREEGKASNSSLSKKIFSKLKSKSRRAGQHATAK